MSNVNIATTLTVNGKAKTKKWPNSSLLLEMQRAIAAMTLDLANAGGQVAAGLLPKQNGPFDQSMKLAIVVTHLDGTAHNSTTHVYENFSKEGVDFVKSIVARHLSPFNAVAQ